MFGNLFFGYISGSPEARQLKKFNFDCREMMGSQNVPSKKNSGKRKSNLPSLTLDSLTTASSSSSVNLESSKLSSINSLGPIEPSEALGKRKLKKLRREERDKTKGPGWFDLPKAAMTQERKQDIEALQLRSALDNKRFYKRNTLANRPKYFQVGRILDNPVDFYHSRVPRKQRKKTIAEEMVQEVTSTVSHL